MDNLNVEVLEDSCSILDDDGHFIDDPLFVVNVDLDFSNLGLNPIHHGSKSI